MLMLRTVLVAACGLFLLLRHLRGLCLCLSPTLLRVRPAREDEIDPELAARMEEELSPLGFRPLSAHIEQPPLARPTVQYDFVNDETATFATGAMGKGGARLYLVTPFPSSRVPSFVLTADHKRPYGEQSKERLVGGIQVANPEALVAMHRRRLDSFGKTPGQVPMTTETRLAIAQAFRVGPASRELRLANLYAGVIGGLGAILFATAIISALGE